MKFAEIFGNKSINKFVILAFTIILAMLLLEQINNRFWLNDFKVFFLATKALLHDEQVYGIPFGLGSGYYKYSPFILILFIPYTIFSFSIAASIHFLVIGICAIAAVIVLQILINQYLFDDREKKYISLYLIFLCIIVHLVRELHLGNVNMILIFLLSLSLKFILEGRSVKSGLLLAIVLLTKPYFIICFFPLLINKRYREIISTIIFIALFVIIPSIFIGFFESVSLYSQWFYAMLEHSNYLSSNHTIFSLLENYTGILIQPKFGLPLLIVIGIISCIYFWKLNCNKNQLANNKTLIIHFFVLISIIPNILITDTEHFLFSLPLITILILYLRKKENYKWLILFIPLIFMYGGNSSDLLGKNLSGKFEDFGMLGLSNLIIISAIIFLYSSNGKKVKEPKRLFKD